MCGTQSGKDVNMIARAADGMSDATLCTHDTAEIFVQTRTQIRRKPRFPILGAEDEMVVQREMCGGHDGYFRRPCRDAFLFFRVIR